MKNSNRYPNLGTFIDRKLSMDLDSHMNFKNINIFSKMS